MRECSQARKKKAPRAPTRVLKKGVRNVELKKKIKSRTSPGPPATATPGLLRGVFGAGARRRAAAAVLLVLQTPRAEGAWRRIERARGGESWTEMKKLEAQRRGGKIVLSPLTRRLVFFCSEKRELLATYRRNGTNETFHSIICTRKRTRGCEENEREEGGRQPLCEESEKGLFQKRGKGKRGEAKREREGKRGRRRRFLPSLSFFLLFLVHAAFADATLALAALPAASISSATAAAPPPSEAATAAEAGAAAADAAAAADDGLPPLPGAPGLGGGESALRPPPSACRSLLCALARAAPHRACGLSIQNLAVRRVA